MIKEKLKRRKKFLRQEHFRYKKLKKKWRRPKGRQSKMRLGKKGKPKKASYGYGSQKVLRGLVHGFTPVYVANQKDLEKIKTSEAIIISSDVGLKKVLEISKKADELGIRLLNVKKIKRAKKLLEEIERKREKKIMEKEKTKKESEKQEKEKKGTLKRQ